MPKTTQEIYDELLRKNRPESAARNGEGLTPNRETPVYKLPSGAGTIGSTTMPKTAQQQANDLLGQINNRPAFSYDPDTDPLWQAMVNQYVHQGQRAMKDTMGQAAGLTGGYGSSYAQAAGQQQYDEYLTRLNGELGTVYDRARAAYDAEGQDLYNRYNLALGAAQDAYNRDRDAMADQRYAREYADDQAYREWQMQQAELDRQDSKDKAAQSQAYEMAMTMISTGQTPPAELLSAAGISPEFASSMSSYYARMAAAQQSGGGSGSTSSSPRRYKQSDDKADIPKKDDAGLQIGQNELNDLLDKAANMGGDNGLAWLQNEFERRYPDDKYANKEAAWQWLVVQLQRRRGGSGSAHGGTGNGLINLHTIS